MGAIAASRVLQWVTIFPSTIYWYIDSGESYNRKSTIVNIHFSTRLQKPFKWFRSKDHGHGKVWTTLGLNSSKGYNLGRNDLAQKWEDIHKQYLHQFSYGNGIENNEVVKQRASIVAQGFTQIPNYSPEVESLSDNLYHWQYKSSISVVDRCSDYISMSITRFRHIWLILDGVSLPNRNAIYIV